MNKIPEPAPNTPLSASWARLITRAINGMRIHGGRGILISRDANGINISATSTPPPAPSAATPAPAQAADVVLCEVSGNIHPPVGIQVRVLPNYPETTGYYYATLYCPEIAWASAPPAGTVMIAHRLSLAEVPTEEVTP